MVAAQLRELAKVEASIPQMVRPQYEEERELLQAALQHLSRPSPEIISPGERKVRREVERMCRTLNEELGLAD
jgi:hypothetical protein